MKILFLTTHLNPGGITSYLNLLTEGLIRNGHDVYIGSGGGQNESYFAAMGAKVRTFNIRTKSELDLKIYGALFPIIDFIKKENIDVVHSQTRITQVLGQWIRRTTGVPHCSTCHGFFKVRWSRKLLPCWGDRVIAISPAVFDHLSKDFGIHPRRIKLIRHGVDIDHFPQWNQDIRHEKRKEFKLNGHPTIGIIARLSDVKGHDILIKAMKKVLEKFPETHLLIVGEGKMEFYLKDLVTNLNIKENIQFIPVVNKTSEILPLFDIFVLPSLQEGLGLSVMEAQACGLPVIASRIGGLPTLVEDNKTGLLVEPKDVDGLAKAIMAMLEDPKRAEQMGRNAREMIKNEFSSTRMIEQTIELYQEIPKTQ